MRSIAAAALIVSGALVISVGAQKTNAPTLEVLLQRVAAYLTDYAKSYAAVVAEEKYIQTLQDKRATAAMPQGMGEPPIPGAASPQAVRRRELKSDIISAADTGQTWLSFRDVFAVDGKNVRDRDERLQKLFLDPVSTAFEKARSIADEGARFNLGSMSRNVNFPTMALTFLQPANQSRSKFALGGNARLAGVEAVVLEFEEIMRPTIVRSGGDDLPVKGRVWLEPATGRVLKTDINFDSRFFGGEVTVTYGLVEKLNLWLPLQMEENSSNALQSVTGRASYSNFRRFGVSTDVIIK